MHRYHPPLTDLVARLELELGHPCQANAYLTPPGSQGFAVHSDSHDVFVFQTHGTKQWEVHHPRGERPATTASTQRLPVDDVLLRPGLSMYLPTGTPHAARAQDDASLHVTIGINQLTWRGLVRRTVDQLLDEVDEPSTCPPAGSARPEELAPGSSTGSRPWPSRWPTSTPPRPSTARSARFLTSRNSRLRGGLHDVLAVDRIGRRHRAAPPRRAAVCASSPVGDRLRLLVGDRFVEVPARIAGAVDVVRDRETLTPADLGLDAASTSCWRAASSGRACSRSGSDR